MSKCRSGSESRLSKLRSCESLTNTSKKVPSKVQYVSSILEPKDTKDVTMIKVKNLKIRMISGMPNSTEDESNVTALITEVSPNFAPTTVKLPQYQHEEGNRFSIAPTSNEPRPTDEVSMNRLTEDLRVTIFALSGKSTSQRFTQTKPNND